MLHLNIPDPTGISARGYVQGGNNQPYASKLADVMQACYKHTNSTAKLPRLDDNARRFIHDYISTEHFNSQRVNTLTIREGLRRC